MTYMAELVLFFIGVLGFSAWIIYRAEKKKPRGYRG